MMLAQQKWDAEIQLRELHRARLEAEQRALAEIEAAIEVEIQATAVANNSKPTVEPARAPCGVAAR
jgi:hypothetical protein